jgi:FkbM family methyltransferase
VVFTDVVMPGVTGIDLAREIRRRHFDLPVVLTSGYSHVLSQNGTYGFELLQKPYSIEQLTRVLHKVARWRILKRGRGMIGTCPGQARMALESSAKPVMHAPLSQNSHEDVLTAPTLPPGIAAANDTTSPPFGAFAPNAPQQAVISLAQRSRLKRGAFRPMLSRLVNLLRAGPVDVQYQGAAFRFYHQASATERGALFNPDYNIEELDFLRKHTPAGGVFVDVGANVGTYTMPLAQHVGRSGKVIAIEPHPVTHARLAFNRAASGFTQVILVAAAAGSSDGELMIETDGDNLGASHIVSAERAGKAIKVPSLRLQRILDDAGVAHVDALKIDVEGYEDRVLTGFFKEAPPSLWPGAVVIEHLSRNEWLDDCIADMRGRGYAETGKTRSNTLLVKQ